MVRLYNTLTRKIEDFEPISDKKIGMYSCGPTVYDYQHIGHMRRYVGDDILVRVLQANGYHVKHVMNITDVGHLVSDSDTGEDKMEKGAKKFGKSVWEIAKMFEEQFWQSTDALDIIRPDVVMHATDYIKEQIELIQILEKKGYTYQLTDGIYFDTSKFPEYFALSHQHPDELKKGARVDFVEGKKNISDFALWKLSAPEAQSQNLPAGRQDTSEVSTARRQMEWESPWGVGFPGWHIECSAMSMKALGEILDIHTGGIDHIAIHHTNEIAQSEAATGKQFVRYWVHHNFLIVAGQKMSKSLGNFITVQDVVAKGHDALSLRYLYLQTHYRQEMNFTWEALTAAESSLTKLRQHVISAATTNPNEIFSDAADDTWMHKFMDALNDDLNTAKALATLWEMVKDTNLSQQVKTATLLKMDSVLGLGLRTKGKEKEIEIPQAVQDFLQEREAFRKAGDFAAADEMRKKIEDVGFRIEDSKDGPKVHKK